jgi:hypothetical protein
MDEQMDGMNLSTFSFHSLDPLKGRTSSNYPSVKALKCPESEAQISGRLKGLKKFSTKLENYSNGLCF